jgi:hypothetical protein
LYSPIAFEKRGAPHALQARAERGAREGEAKRPHARKSVHSQQPLGSCSLERRTHSEHSRIGVALELSEAPIAQVEVSLAVEARVADVKILDGRVIRRLLAGRARLAKMSAPHDRSATGVLKPS